MKSTKITLYDAEHYSKGRSGVKVVYIKKANFETEEALNKHIEELKAIQKEKNRLFKEQRNTQPHPKMIEKPKTPLTYMENIKLALDINTGNTTVLLASSKSGKTTLLKQIYKKYYDDKKIISILFTANPQISLYSLGKNIIKYTDFNENAMKLIRMTKYINTKTKNEYNFTLLFDDILNTKHSSLFNNLICTYRNSNISTVICLQYPLFLSKANRCNVNNVILGSFLTDEAIEIVVKIYLVSHFKTMGLLHMPEMINKYRELTTDHGFILLSPAKNIIKYIRLKK